MLLNEIMCETSSPPRCPQQLIEMFFFSSLLFLSSTDFSHYRSSGLSASERSGKAKPAMTIMTLNNYSTLQSPVEAKGVGCEPPQQVMYESVFGFALAMPQWEAIGTAVILSLIIVVTISASSKTFSLSHWPSLISRSRFSSCRSTLPTRYEVGGILASTCAKCGSQAMCCAALLRY
jgi:hypothetical protein